MSYRERMYFIFTNQDGKTTRIKIPVYLDGFEPVLIKRQIDEILQLGILLDTKDHNRYLVKCKKMEKVEILKTPVFDMENPFAMLLR